MKKSTILITVSFFIVYGLMGTTYTYTGYGNWNTTANWDVYPGSMLHFGDTAIISSSGYCIASYNFQNFGKIYNYGIFNTTGNFENAGYFENNDTYLCTGLNLFNYGTFKNNDLFNNLANFVNNGTFINCGTWIGGVQSNNGTINPNGDDDSDLLDASCDNCPFVYNPGQEDADGDGVGDACESPVPSDMQVMMISSTSGELSWTENATATSWYIMVGPADFDTTSFSPLFTSDNPYTISGLMPGESYDWYIRSNIDFGDWVGPHTFHPCLMDVKVFLEGPFNGTEMNTDLNDAGMIPSNQPYDIEPWFYSGTDNVSSIPNPDIVDWVLLEIREVSGEPCNALPDSSILKKAAFLLNNGQVVDLDGGSLPSFNLASLDNYYLVIWHRNHLPIMSSVPLIESMGVYSYDFTDQISKSYEEGQKEIAPEVFGMAGGDCDANGKIEMEDKDLCWTGEAGNVGYVSGDWDLNAQVNNPDKNDIWSINMGYRSTVPKLFEECGDKFIDSRDNQLYNTVQIGSQCWMAENLNIGTRIDGMTEQTDNGIVEKYCFDNLESNCDTYGGLYKWGEAMSWTITTPGAQGNCPNGWNIPTDGEWKILEGTVDSQYPIGDPVWNNTGWNGYDVGNKLKSIVGWNIPGGTNSSGFSALPGGRRLANGTFELYGENSFMWSSTVYTAGNAFRRGLQDDIAMVSRWIQDQDMGQSVRCIKNMSPDAPDNPNPANGSNDVGINNDLSWTCNDPEGDPLTFDVYFGTDPDPPLVSEGLTDATYDPGTMSQSTSYYWKVAAFDIYGDSAVSSVWNFTTSVLPAIGDYAFGGVVFWVDGSGGGLVCAINDQGGGEWGCYGTAINGADGIAIGTGAQNTIDILADCSTPGIAADICADLSLNGYTDWFLPSHDELTAMYVNRETINATAIANGGAAFLNVMENSYYWSSSEANPASAVRCDFYFGSAGSYDKYAWGRVRASRAF